MKPIDLMDCLMAFQIIAVLFCAVVIYFTVRRATCQSLNRWGKK